MIFSGFGEGSIRAASEVIRERVGARAQRQLLLRRTKNVLVSIFVHLVTVRCGSMSGSMPDQVSCLPEALPDQRGHHLTLYLRRRHHARFGRQFVGHDRIASRGIHQPHQIPVRLRLAGKYPKKCWNVFKSDSVYVKTWYVDTTRRIWFVFFFVRISRFHGNAHNWIWKRF